MKLPQFKDGNLGTIYGKRMPVYKIREIDAHSILGLYLSQVLLYIGFVLIFFNNLNIFEPNSYFGMFNWVTIAVFVIGFFINFISIPYLYFSSFRNFKKENDFWDKETFWIMPLFFFGSFFIYGNRSDFTFAILAISIIAITVLHCRFFYLSWKLADNKLTKNLASREQYSVTLKYITAYYILLLILFIMYNPMQRLLTWMS